MTVTGGIGSGSGSGGPGGGILNTGNLTLTNVSVVGNTTYTQILSNGPARGENPGGGIANLNGQLTIVDSTISGNTAPGAGGGLYCGEFSSTTLTDVTIADNDGQGIDDIFSKNLTLNNVTLSGNTETGITYLSNYEGEAGPSVLDVGNSIIAGNLAIGPSGGDVYTYAFPDPTQTVYQATSLGHNLIGNVGTTTGWLSSDLTGSAAKPLGAGLGLLSSNGGPTQTMAPQFASPVIDAGSNALIPSGVAADQRGLPRISGASVDIGAVEVQGLASLYGTPIGTSGSWDGTSTIYKVFDGNLSSYFDSPTASLNNWVGLDLGETATISQIRFAPRAGYEFRMLGGQFQVSTTPDFSSNVKTVATLTSTPTAGALTTLNVTGAAGYRYVRYTGGTQWVNIAEMQVFGTELPNNVVTMGFSGATISVGGASYPSNSASAAFDGNPSTFFDPASGGLTNWVGLDLGTPQQVTRISYAPRVGYEFRMFGGQFQVSSTPDFSSDVHTVYTVTQIPTAYIFTTVNFETAGAYRYVRYTGGTQWVNIAEMQVAGIAGPTKLSGTAIGTAASWSSGSSIKQAFDGDLKTYFDPATSDLNSWVGLDLGSTKAVSLIKFAPRAGYEFRMFGGMFQASNTADFSSGVVTLYTIASIPVANQMTTISVNPTGVAYRYYRYTGGTQWVNIAEMELDG